MFVDNGEETEKRPGAFELVLGNRQLECPSLYIVYLNPVYLFPGMTIMALHHVKFIQNIKW